MSGHAVLFARCLCALKGRGLSVTLNWMVIAVLASAPCECNHFVFLWLTVPLKVNQRLALLAHMPTLQYLNCFIPHPPRLTWTGGAPQVCCSFKFGPFHGTVFKYTHGPHHLNVFRCREREEPCECLQPGHQKPKSNRTIALKPSQNNTVSCASLYYIVQCCL